MGVGGSGTPPSPTFVPIKPCPGPLAAEKARLVAQRVRRLSTPPTRAFGRNGANGVPALHPGNKPTAVPHGPGIPPRPPSDPIQAAMLEWVDEERGGGGQTAALTDAAQVGRVEGWEKRCRDHGDRVAPMTQRQQPGLE